MHFKWRWLERTNLVHFKWGSRVIIDTVFFSPNLQHSFFFLGLLRPIFKESILRKSFSTLDLHTSASKHLSTPLTVTKTKRPHLTQPHLNHIYPQSISKRKEKKLIKGTVRNSTNPDFSTKRVLETSFLMETSRKANYLNETLCGSRIRPQPRRLKGALVSFQI